MVKMEKVFPIILIILDMAASITYCFYFNWKMSVYWLAAAVLTICVTI